VKLAATHGIRVALSSPCIELWFLIHFENQTAYLPRDEAQRKSGSYITGGKTPSPESLSLLVDNYATAKQRAQELDKKHEGDGSPPHSNPSSNLWVVVDWIRGTS
jgi:hypothetical protein